MTRAATKSVATEAVREWLARLDRKPTRVGSGEWDLIFTNGRPFPARARADDRGMRLELALDAIDPWVALRMNDALRGARLVCTDSVGGRLCLRSEVQFGKTASTGERLAQLDLGLERNLETIEAHESGNEVAVEATEDPNDVELAALRERLDRAGWPVHDHPDGRVAIDVSSPGRRARASVRRTAKATFRISTSVSKVPITSELGRWAVARFLLSAAAGYRVVRPAARSDRTVHLEVELHPEDADRGIDLCLGALAHASRDSAREVELLAGNPQAAAAYAAVLPDAETPTLQEE